MLARLDPVHLVGAFAALDVASYRDYPRRYENLGYQRQKPAFGCRFVYGRFGLSGGGGGSRVFLSRLLRNGIWRIGYQVSALLSPHLPYELVGHLSSREAASSPLPIENDTAEKCANAASNTGYFLLRALGYSSDEIKALR